MKSKSTQKDSICPGAKRKRRNKLRLKTIAFVPSSSPFPLLHHLGELLEQIMRIMRSRRSLRVILHAKQRQIPVPQSLERLVIQVDMGQLNFTVGQRIRIDGEVVVVRGDLDLSGLQLFYRMVPAVVPKLQLESLAAEGNPRKLMPQADTKNRLPPHEPADRIDR